MPSQNILDSMKEKGIDADLSLKILEDYNAGLLGREPKLTARDIPEVDGRAIIAMQDGVRFSIDSDAARDNLSRFGLADMVRERGALTFDRAALERIGTRVLPFTAYGVLAGGGSTTYADHKRNQSLDPGLFSRFEKVFEASAAATVGKPKGIASAFLNPDGSPGPSYMTLKQRALLLLIRDWEKAESERMGRKVRGLEAPGGNFPLRPFQMASIGNSRQLTQAQAQARESDLTAGLIRDTGCDVSSFLSSEQPMIAAYSHSSEGAPKRIFTQAYGTSGELLALPGGHGQNFRYLKGIYEGLRREGKKYAYLSNVDNLGALPSCRELGIMALSGKKAGFDFSYRTPMDVKGGILLHDESGRMACGDIGGAIPFEDVLALEREDKPALFNCATGLFDLDWLCDSLGDISARLPTRFTDQDKDAGRYSQAEQNTWEVIGLIDDPVIFAVEKSERFLAAKMLMETILMSMAEGGERGSPAWETAKGLKRGLEALLSHRYGMKLAGKRWVQA